MVFHMMRDVLGANRNPPMSCLAGQGCHTRDAQSDNAVNFVAGLLFRDAPAPWRLNGNRIESLLPEVWSPIQAEIAPIQQVKDGLPTAGQIGQALRVGL